MKALTLIATLFISSTALAGNQYMFCTNSDIEVSVCWSTAELQLKTSAGLEDLIWLPLNLEGRENVYATEDRSVLVKTVDEWPVLLIDEGGKKHPLKCGDVQNGSCH